MDLIIGGCGGGGTTTCTTLATTKIYINNGTTLTENSTWQSNLEKIFRGSSVFGDIDNDGDSDLVLCGNNGTTGIVKIYLNNGTTLTENQAWQQNFTGTNPWGCSLAFGDIDNDGDSDLAFVGADNTIKNGIYINNGTSFVKNNSWLASLPLVGQTLGNGVLAFGDIDNDGDSDLIFLGSRSTDFYRQVYINNATSLVENSVWENNIWAWGWPSLTLGDYDNDGDLDLFSMGTTAGDRCHLYNNNGSAFTVNETENTGLCGIFDGSFTLGDYDNDGDLDLAANGKEGHTSLHINNQTDFVFETTETNNLKALQTGSSILWLDLDNDADLDIIETGLNNSGSVDVRVYTSNRSLTNTNTKPSSPNSSFSTTYTNNILTLSWGNGSDAETNTSGLYYNLRVGNSTNNNSIVSGVYGGSSNPTAGYFGNMMQRKSIALNVQLEANKTYYWYVQTIDTGLAKSNWSVMQNFTIAIDVTKPNITINEPSPNESLHTTNPYFVFNITVTDTNLTNVTLYADFNGTMLANETNSSGINGTYVFIRNLTNYNDNIYSWYIYACDGNNNCQTSGRSFYLDRSAPVVRAISPANGGSWTNSNVITFSYNVSDVDIANCSLVVNNAIVNTSTSISENIEQNFTYSLSNGNYNWNVNCTDYVGYTNSSANRTLTVNYVPSTSTGGGGGGSGGTSTTIKTYAITNEQLSLGYTQSLAVNDKIKFSINKKNHSLIVNSANETLNYANLTLNSTLINFIIYINETRKFELTSDNYYDLFVKINGIENNKANLTIKQIYEKIEVGEKEEAEGEKKAEEDEKEKEEDEEEERKEKLWLWIIGLVAVIILLIMFLRRYIKYRQWKRYTLIG